MTTPSVIPVATSGRTALEIARASAREAGERVRAQFKLPKEVTVKGRGDLVTKTDLEIEAYLQQTLVQEFPEHRVLSEETAADTDTAGWVWVIDPIDGTRNFVSGVPFFCISLALCHDGEPVVAVTHDPNQNEAFWAERGHGAWVNDEPLRASSQPTVEASVLGFGLGYDDQRARALLELLHRLYPDVQTLRDLGSAALGLAYAAAGRHDLFIHSHLFAWDIAAGILLVREAGGVITDGTGLDPSLASQSVIAGGQQAHADFLRWQQEQGLNLGDPAI